MIGSDARPGGKVEGHRADSVHIVSTIPATGTASIVGIPRDSWVAVTYEGYGEVNGMDKLTHTMASKGPEVVVETVTNLSGVELDGYLLTGFAGFEDLIDAFGGVTVDVPYRMNDINHSPTSIQANRCSTVPTHWPSPVIEPTPPVATSAGVSTTA